MRLADFIQMQNGGSKQMVVTSLVAKSPYDMSGMDVGRQMLKFSTVYTVVDWKPWKRWYHTT